MLESWAQIWIKLASLVAEGKSLNRLVPLKSKAQHPATTRDMTIRVSMCTRKKIPWKKNVSWSCAGRCSFVSFCLYLDMSAAPSANNSFSLVVVSAVAILIGLFFTDIVIKVGNHSDSWCRSSPFYQALSTGPWSPSAAAMNWKSETPAWCNVTSQKPYLLKMDQACLRLHFQNDFSNTSKMVELFGQSANCLEVLYC